MFKNPSLITRIAIGKTVGMVFGILGFIMVPWFWPGVSSMMQWAILLWYITVGAVIGMFGVFTWHPILHLPMPWWFRAPLLGGWMNFVLTLFIYDKLQTMMINYFGVNSTFSSPFWFAVEGALVGLIIGYLATRFGGEGKQVVEEKSEETGI
ncbi:MAG: hypothetical protein P8J14_05565 [Emcibacteraceae bacterium]|nr:hypothetical protein [Emcibacteraceae bacterium]